MAYEVTLTPEEMLEHGQPNALRIPAAMDASSYGVAAKICTAWDMDNYFAHTLSRASAAMLIVFLMTGKARLGPSTSQDGQHARERNPCRTIQRSVPASGGRALSARGQE